MMQYLTKPWTKPNASQTIPKSQAKTFWFIFDKLAYIAIQVVLEQNIHLYQGRLNNIY